MHIIATVGLYEYLVEVFNIKIMYKFLWFNKNILFKMQLL